MKNPVFTYSIANPPTAGEVARRLNTAQNDFTLTHCGDLYCWIAYCDNDDESYLGCVFADGYAWVFDDLRAPRILLQGSPLQEGYDSYPALCHMAQSAASFADHCTSGDGGESEPAVWNRYGSHFSEAASGDQDDDGPVFERWIPTHELLGTMGDVDPVEHDGGVVTRGEHGIAITYWEAIDDTDDAYRVMYQCDVPEDVSAHHDWADFQAIADGQGIDLEEFVKVMVDADPMVRAHAVVDIAQYHGWANVDAYGITQTPDAAKRAYNHIMAQCGKSEEAYAIELTIRGTVSMDFPEGSEPSDWCQYVADRLLELYPDHEVTIEPGDTDSATDQDGAEIVDFSDLVTLWWDDLCADTEHEQWGEEA